MLNQYSDVSGTAHAYDKRGNLTSDGTSTYGYNTENQLISAAAAGQSLSFTYDAIGRRLLKQVTAGSTTTTTGWLSVGDQEMAEFAGVGTIYLQKRFAYGTGIDEPIASFDPANIATYHFADALGSVIALTNAAGQVTEKHAYTAYGLDAITGPNTASYRFAGRRLDPETGLYYNRARYYSTTLGRFLQTDPIGTKDDVNLYAYVKNDPVNLIDPMGKNALSYQVAASTNNPTFAARMLGINRIQFGEIIHNLKEYNGLKPNDNVQFYDNGDVHFRGKYIDNIFNY